MQGEHERIDDLQRGGLRIIQDERLFCFSVDAVLLAHFATVKKGDCVCDLCSGNGIIPLLLWADGMAQHIDGVELLEASALLAERSIALNGLQGCIQMHCMNARQAAERLGRGGYQLVTCNPPYQEAGGGLASMSRAQFVARHEVEITLRELIEQSALLLNAGGRLAMVHRPERLADLMCLMREYGLEPKRMRMVHPTAAKAPTMVLVEGLKGGRPKLRVEPPLIVHRPGGGYTEEIDRIYHRGEET